MKQLDSLIAIWSMRPAPGSPEGIAWEMGAKQGWIWAVERAAKKAEDYQFAPEAAADGIAKAIKQLNR